MREQIVNFISNINLGYTSLIILLSHYKDKLYLDKIFNIINSINLDYYYVKMAKSWLLCELFINFKEETLNFINNFVFKVYCFYLFILIIYNWKIFIFIKNSKYSV